jgi:hypothetical protein
MRPELPAAARLSRTRLTRLTPAQDARLCAAAAKRGIPVAQVLRDAVEQLPDPPV